MLTMMMLTMLSPAFAVEECESDPGYPFPQLCCDPLPVDACAKQAVPSDMSDVYWITGNGDYHDWGAWDTGPTRSDLAPWNGLFKPTSFGASDGVNNPDVTCALTKAAGDIWCWGNVNSSGHITGRPTGGSPYKSLDTGNWGGTASGMWVALDNTGVIKKWGKANASFDAAIPTASGFESVSMGYGAACAVDEATAGVTCWGDNTQLIVSGRPTTGNYKQVALSRFNALAVTTTGGVVTWGPTMTQYANFRTEVANAVAAVASPVVEAHLHETGRYAVLYHQDRTLTIVEEENTGQNDIIGYAPCGSGSCPTGGSTDNYHTNVQFRTAPRINENKPEPLICGVVADDPGGLYTCGEVICWGDALHTSGAPRSFNECSVAEQAICELSE